MKQKKLFLNKLPEIPSPTGRDDNFFGRSKNCQNNNDVIKKIR